jgi:hypothetical protein
MWEEKTMLAQQDNLPGSSYELSMVTLVEISEQ